MSAFGRDSSVGSPFRTAGCAAAACGALALVTGCGLATDRPRASPSVGGGDRLLAELARLPALTARDGGLTSVDVGWERRPALALDPGSHFDWTAAGTGDLRLSVSAAGQPGRVEISFFDSTGRAAGAPRGLQAVPGRWTDERLGWPEGARRVRFTAAQGRVLLSDPRREPTSRPGPDVVLVSLDTVGRNRMSLHGHPRATTPHLAAWAARQAAVFDRALAAAGGTLPSHASLLSGRSPLRTGVIEHALAGLAPDLPLLAEHFRDRGYRTVALTGGGFLHPDFGFARGFDRYEWTEREALAALPDQIAEAVRTLGEREGRPLFLFLHTYAAHEPFEARGHFPAPPGCGPAGTRLRFALAPDQVSPARPQFEDAAGRPVPAPDAPERCVEWLYDEGLAALDAALGPLLDAFEQHPRALVVAITSDHGEATGAGGLYGHGWVDPAVFRVPLLVAGPGFPAGTRRDDLACGQDVGPTLLEAAGGGRPAGLDGRSLAATTGSVGCDLIAPNPWLTLAHHGPLQGLLRVNVAPGAGLQRAWYPRFDHAGQAPVRPPPADAESSPLLAEVARLAAARGLEIVHDGSRRIDVEVRTAPEGAWVEFPPAGLVDAAEEDVYRVSLGRSATLWLGLTARARGRLTLRLDGRPFAVELDTAARALEWTRSGTGWVQRTLADPGPRPGVRLRWPGATPAPSPRDDAHLRALGYVR